MGNTKAIFKENQQALKKKKDNNSPKPSLKQSERKEMEKIGFHFLFELRSCLNPMRHLFSCVTLGQSVRYQKELKKKDF